MVWRIHFTPADLGRIRVGAALGPLAETLMALCLIRSSCQPPARLGGWKERAGRQLTAQMKPLAALFPAGRPGVDLWTLTGYAPTIEDGVGALLKVPREHLLAEMTVVDRRSRLPASAWAVADEGSDARLRFADAVLAAYRVLVEPHWTGMNSRLRAEQAYRGHILANGGVEHLLATIQGPRVRWRPPVLELLGVGHGDVYLDGRANH